MNSNKPYLLRALFEWIVDNDLTPHLVVSATSPNLMVPSGIENNGQIVLNISPSAVTQLDMSNEAISFSARFSGKSEHLYLPINAILAIYARENGEGMMFQESAQTELEEPENKSAPAKISTKKKSKKPSLTVVK